MEVKIVKLSGDDKYQRLLGGAPETSGMKAGHVALKPGEEVGSHNTGDKEEAILILSGKAEICHKDRSTEAGENSLVHVPPDTEHNVRNAGEGVLRYVYVTSPAR